MSNVNYEATVAKYFREKDDNGYTKSPTYFGAEQRFVGALRNSNSNNLEEQFLLGTDAMITAWEDEEGNLHIKKEYYVQDTGDDDGQKISSYILNTVIKGKDTLHNEEYYFDGEDIKVLQRDMKFIDEILTIDNDIVYNYMEDSLALNPTQFIVTKEDLLQFVDKDGNIVDVAKKTTSRKASGDGKLYTQTRVENLLK